VSQPKSRFEAGVGFRAPVLDGLHVAGIGRKGRRRRQGGEEEGVGDLHPAILWVFTELWGDRCMSTDVAAVISRARKLQA
jgi:hypothetical protein